MTEKFRLLCRRAAKYVWAVLLVPLLVKFTPLVINRFADRLAGRSKPPKKSGPLDQGHFETILQIDGRCEMLDSAGRTKSFDLTLPDGTRVRLGFCSSLHYTCDFNGERRVFLNGQAEFFVVPNNDRPMMIQTARSTIQVLGTTVCVTDFACDSSCEVTLLTGMANISHDGETLPLKVLQQAVIHDGQLSIRRPLHPEKCIGWANDDDRYLEFDDMDLFTAVQRMARWYGAKVIPLRDLREVTVTAEVRLSLSLDENLTMLRKLETGHAQIDKKGLTIYLK